MDTPHDTIPAPVPVKVCTKCKAAKALEEFSRNAYRKDGLQHRCKACVAGHYLVNRKAIRAKNNVYSVAHRREKAAYDKARYVANPEKKLAQCREWYAENREAAIEASRHWALAHPEKDRARKDAWAAANPEKVRARGAAYRAAHPHAVRIWRVANPEAYRAHNHSRRAWECQAEGSHTGADIRDLFVEQVGLCRYCGCDLDDSSYHVDHVLPLSRGGSDSRENLALTCPTCNLSKGAKILGEWLGAKCKETE